MILTGLGWAAVKGYPNIMFCSILLSSTFSVFGVLSIMGKKLLNSVLILLFYHYLSLFNMYVILCTYLAFFLLAYILLRKYYISDFSPRRHMNSIISLYHHFSTY